jgi:hypothetical protein
MKWLTVNNVIFYNMKWQGPLKQNDATFEDTSVDVEG